MFLIIGSAVLSLLIVALGITLLGRNVVGLVRTAKSFQRLTEPHIQRITHTVEVIQDRALAISTKADLLQRRAFLLTLTLQKLKTLLTIWQKAMEPVNRVRSYVGL